MNKSSFSETTNLIEPKLQSTYKKKPVILKSLGIPVNPYECKWLLFNANSAIFQLYHGENKLSFNEMMMKSALY